MASNFNELNKSRDTKIEGKEIAVKLIEYQSPEYQQACELRYRLFYQKHGLPWKTVIKSRDALSFHAAIALKENIVAYGQLTPSCDRIYQIRQMVIEPKYQKQNFGKQILFLLNRRALVPLKSRIVYD